jgi:hypothetical protein
MRRAFRILSWPFLRVENGAGAAIAAPIIDGGAKAAVSGV